MRGEAEELKVSFFYPVYKDEATIREVAERAIAELSNFADEFEILIVNDGSPDRCGEIANELAAEHPGILRVIHHETNQGYGAAVKTGIAAARFDWICMVDGDHEYDVRDVIRMLRLRDYYALVIGFRYKRLYSTQRIFISRVYNFVLRQMFKTRFRDVSTGIRVFHRRILDGLNITSDSPFFGAELAIKTMLRGYPVGEMGLQTFPRRFGSGSAVTPRNVLLTIRDMLRTRREVFSDAYQLPPGRQRDDRTASEPQGINSATSTSNLAMPPACSDPAKNKLQTWRLLCVHVFQRYVSPDDVVLNIASGYGEFSRHIAAARKIAIDMNEDASTYLPPEVEFHRASAVAMPFLANNEVDVCFSSNFFEHLASKAEMDAVLVEAFRVLKPGGRYVALQPNLRFAAGEYWDYYDHVLPLTDRSAVEAFRKAGFEIERVVPRFLPFSTKSRLPQHPLLVAAYLRVPLVWRLLGRQFLLVAQKPS